MNQPRKVVSHPGLLTEGPCWDTTHQTLYWVDILSHKVHSFVVSSREHKTFNIGMEVTALAPRQTGGLILAVEKGFATLCFESGKTTTLCTFEADKPNNRFNDGKCDPTGRFWAGTMDRSERHPNGALYRMDKNQQVTSVLSGVTISNGLAWNPAANVMYYIDTPTRCVDALDYDNATGEIGNRRSVIRFPPDAGNPDGMAIDQDGMLWVAEWGGWRVGRWDPVTGKLIESVQLPVARVTACAFGGPMLDELYITTARVGLSETELLKQPLAGHLFVVTTKVRGIASHEYAG